MPDNTTIKLRRETRDRLRSIRPDLTFDDAINELCEQAEDEAFWRDMDDWATRRQQRPEDVLRGEAEVANRMLRASRL